LNSPFTVVNPKGIEYDLIRDKSDCRMVFGNDWFRAKEERLSRRFKRLSLGAENVLLFRFYFRELLAIFFPCK